MRHRHLELNPGAELNSPGAEPDSYQLLGYHAEVGSVVEVERRVYEVHVVEDVEEIGREPDAYSLTYRRALAK